jgi:hypothetical protein
MKIEDWIYDHLGIEWCGKGGGMAPPGDHLTLEFGEPNDDGRPVYVASTTNDGFELYVGFRNEWLFHCWAGDARRIAWFVLWDWWIKSTWFGLKRIIWYWALGRRVAKYRGLAK